NAGSFKTQKGANVEKLLEKLPGIEVDSDGEITAQGEKVNKIYVDGKEFFGDDPKIATKNIPADAIDKVQVFDKKSELSEFTGVDDGERSRTINITLKKDRKKGIFGEATAGGGPDNRYKGKLNLNRFSETAQFTALLMANNVNEQGFSYRDYFNFMGGISNVMKTGKSNFDPSSTGVPINIPGANNGIASTLAGGINYNQDIGKATHIISSFFVNNSNSDINRETNSVNYLANSSFASNNTNDQSQDLQNYRLNAKLQHEFNLQNRLDINLIGIYTASKTRELSTGNQLFSDNANNISDGNSYAQGNGINTTLSLDYKKKFDKPGRSLNFLGDFYYLNNETTTELITERTIILKDGTSFNNILNQDQAQLVNKMEYFGKVAFTEQLSPKSFMIADYSYYNQAQENNKDFFDIRSGNSIFNQQLSNFFRSNYNYHQLGFKYNYKVGKGMLVAGLDAQVSSLKGTRDENTESINQDFQVLLPNFTWRKRNGMKSNVSLNYTTTFNEPTISQLQPVLDNSNPLSIYVGNPNLKPEYSHNLNFNWFTYDAFSDRQTGINVSAYAVNNDINNARFFDSISKLQTTSPQNTQDNLGVNTNLRYGFKLSKLKTRIRTAINFGINQGYNLIDDEVNKSLTYNYGGSISLRNTNDKIVRLLLEVSSNANLNQIGISDQQSSMYVNTKIVGEIDVELKKDWEFGITGTQNFFSGRSISAAQNFFILDAFVAKTIFKNKRGYLRLSINDALNQRTGISNYGQANYLTESRVNVLKRYGLVTFSYKIIKI
ncbi:MAG: outer membrane beta-barrel protein, partial [Flavobacteriales bacterium]